MSVSILHIQTCSGLTTVLTQGARLIRSRSTYPRRFSSATRLCQTVPHTSSYPFQGYFSLLQECRCLLMPWPLNSIKIKVHGYLAGMHVEATRFTPANLNSEMFAIGQERRAPRFTHGRWIWCCTVWSFVTHGTLEWLADNVLARHVDLHTGYRHKVWCLSTAKTPSTGPALSMFSRIVLAFCCTT